jgi:hypothetical protein
VRVQTIVVGVFCVVAFVAAAGVYLFDFANKPVSIESMFWIMPMVSPIAYVAYMKVKPIGLAAQAILYLLTVFGAYRMFQNDCIHGGECFTNNSAALVAGSLVSGVHVIAMLGALLLMSAETAKAFRSRQSA